MGVLAVILSVGTAFAAQTAIVVDSDDPALRDLLQRHMSVQLLLDSPGQTDAARRTSVDTEAKRLAGILRNHGFLGAEVEVDWSAEASVRFAPRAGPLYRIGWVRIDGVPADAPDDLHTSLQDFVAAAVGEDATDAALADLRSGATWRMREASYAQATASAPAIALEPDTRTIGVAIDIAAGQATAFGAVRFDGSHLWDDAALAALVPFETGDPYTASAEAALLAALDETGRFRRVTLARAPAAGNLTDIEVELRDQAPDPIAMAQGTGRSVAILLATMIVLSGREAMRATAAWNSPAIRGGVSVATIGMVAVSGVVVAERIVSFLA